jgi:hypothetical protein
LFAITGNKSSKSALFSTPAILDQDTFENKREDWILM